MAAAILISTFGCVNGLVLAGARVYYAVARDGLFFQSVAPPTAGMSRRSPWSPKGLWAGTPGLAGDRDHRSGHGAGRKYGNMYNELLEYVIPVDVIFYTLMVGAVIALRLKAPHLSSPLPDDRLPVPRPDLHRAGGPAGARLHLLEALDFRQGLPDRPGGHSGLSDLVAAAARAAKAPSRGANSEHRTMIVSWNWLTDYVRLDMPVDVLNERLALSGLNLESFSDVGGDIAIDLEVTSNRPDCLGHIGIARGILRPIWRGRYAYPTRRRRALDLPRRRGSA